VYPIRLVAVGRAKSEPILSIEKHYKKLLGAYARLELVEVQDGSGHGERRQLIEAARVRDALAGFRRRVLLSADGEQRTSEEFASWLGARTDLGESLAFAVGPSDGFHPTLKGEVPELMGLSRMTFPHDLCRVMFLEQLYRAFAILHGKVYHK